MLSADIQVVAIHQPNFFPWLGYFSKIIRSDAFIFLDHVQFPKKGGTWCNRVKCLVNGEGRWVTAPVSRNYHGTIPINEMHFSENQKWKINLIKTLETNYSRAKYFDEMMAFFKPLILNEDSLLAEYNKCAVIQIAKGLGVKESKFYLSSEMSHRGHSNELLISLVQTLGANAYICGAQAVDYQDEGMFEAASIELIHQNFSHPTYEQGNGKFCGGLSIVDALMHAGWDGVREMLNVKAEDLN